MPLFQTLEYVLEYQPLFLGGLPQLCTGRHALSDYFKRLNQLEYTFGHGTHHLAVLSEAFFWRGSCVDHSGVMPAISTSLPQAWVSVLTRCSSWAGVEVCGSAPMLRMNSTYCGLRLAV